MDKLTVSIFGTAGAKNGDLDYRLAYELGRLLARAGFTLANGGYGGTMLAAAKGAAEVGGQTIGVTCSRFSRRANSYIDRQIIADSLEERLDTLVRLGCAYVVLPGGTGTLLELAKVWELKNKGLLGEEKPMVLVGGFWRPLVELISSRDPGSLRYVRYAASPVEARDMLVDYARCIKL